MDSKLKKITIIAVISIAMFVVILVLFMNQSRIQKKLPATNNTQVEEIVVEEAGSKSYKGTQVGNDLSAFMSDEQFFDKPKTKYEEYLEQKNTLSLILTSVEKDLRVKIINFDGVVVEGQPFKIIIDNYGEFEDGDQDGIIYIGNLSAGDYSVSLAEIEGYTVPENPARVNVKAQVEYIPIEDISNLIKTEAEIDPELEDTGVWGATEDADKSEVKKLQSSLENAKVGIDVSKWNKEIDWKKVKETGVEFAIIRCGYRGSSSGSLVVDPYFEQNIKGASEAGIDVGVYFFTQAISSVEAVEEASIVLELVKKYQITYPIFIDTEGAGGNGRADNLDVETRTAVCEAFCTTIENSGYDSGVYASKNWFNNRLTAKNLERFTIWLAEYRKVPTYEGVYSMWQYTSKGKVNGIEGNVDLNISYLEENKAEAQSIETDAVETQDQ